MKVKNLGVMLGQTVPLTCRRNYRADKVDHSRYTCAQALDGPLDQDLQRRQIKNLGKKISEAWQHKAEAQPPL